MLSLLWPVPLFCRLLLQKIKPLRCFHIYDSLIVVNYSGTIMVLLFDSQHRGAYGADHIATDHTSQQCNIQPVAWGRRPGAGALWWCSHESEWGKWMRECGTMEMNAWKWDYGVESGPLKWMEMNAWKWDYGVKSGKWNRGYQCNIYKGFTKGVTCVLATVNAKQDNESVRWCITPTSVIWG